MKRLRDGLLLVILLAFAVQVLWRALWPLLPWAGAILVLLLVVGSLYHRKWHW
jgi:hypothetical protein